MNKLTYILFLSLLLSSFKVNGQSLQMGRQVLGSHGAFYSGTGYTFSSTMGEAVMQTLTSSNFMLTQGFQQTYILNDSIVQDSITNETCRGASNGKIDILGILGCTGAFTWTVSPIGDTATTLPFDSLPTGEYLVRITGANGCFYNRIYYVGLDSDKDCILKFYTGITPNGDGRNDSWIIDNIEQFPENKVSIFNRWGTIVYETENYNNDDVVWKGNTGNEDAGEQLETATYFYVATVSGQVYKGWVELTR